ncbi:MAG: hypothetical protein ABI742_06890 [Gemmatimonadota bacterium]
MDTHIRLKLDMGGRVVVFCHAHPDDNPATAPVVARLVDTVGRADLLQLKQRQSITVVAAAVEQKAELRTRIDNSLASLFGIARAASKEHPDLAVHRRLPRPRSSEAKLLQIARVAVAEATTVKDVLAGYGLTDALLTDLAADIAAYEAVLERQRQAQADQVGASKDLDGTVTDLMRVVKNLDAIHRVRFKDNRELKAAWKSARNVAWPSAHPADLPEPAPAPAPGPVTPPAADGTSGK